jgi:hypothetical protein
MQYVSASTVNIKSSRILSTGNRDFKMNLAFGTVQTRRFSFYLLLVGVDPGNSQYYTAYNAEWHD